MELRDHLIHLVAYEKWANEQWLDFFEASTNHPGGGQLAARGDEWLEHIVGCYRHWLNLLSETQDESVGDLRKDLADQTERFSAFIASCDFDKPLRRTWEEYGTYEWTTLQIIYHAISHGSYHRGHIRAIAEELGFDDWPDTDFEAFTGVKIS